MKNLFLCPGIEKEKIFIAGKAGKYFFFAKSTGKI